MFDSSDQKGSHGQPPKAQRSWQMPDTYIILFLIILFSAALTWIIPVGYFGTKVISVETDGVIKSREVVDPDSFQMLVDGEGDLVYHRASLFRGEANGGERIIYRFPSEGQGDTGVMNFVFEGLVSGSKYGAAVGVVAFILVIGGAFGIILRTGAVETGIRWVIRKVGRHAYLVIPVLFLLFSLGGAIFGMGEEAIAFAMIVCPLMVALGYDKVTGLLVTYAATQIGFATSWMNPFSVAVAQGIAGIPVLSGAGFRIGMWACFTIGGILFCLMYARGIRQKDRDFVHLVEPDSDYLDYQEGKMSSAELGWGQRLVIFILILGLIWVIYGVTTYQYYIPEIATQFFIIGLVCGVVGVLFRLEGMGWNDIPAAFRKGAGDLLGAALIVGMAKGILLILGGDNPEEPTVLNSILHFASQGIGDMGPALSAWFMFAFQSTFNFFVSSGSGQAALTMPLMAPLSDLVGVTRQVAVLAFQLGDGLTNLIIPTSAALMGCLGVAKVDWVDWLKVMWKFQLVLMLAASLVVVLAVFMGYQ